MSRTPISSDLIHNDAEVARETDYLNWLCDLTAKFAMPVVREALVRETSGTAAKIWITDAEQILRSVLKDLRVDRDPLLHELQNDFERGLSVSDEEIYGHAHEFAGALIGSWIDVLYFNLRSARRLVLTPYLLPRSNEKEAWLTVLERVAPYAPNSQKEAERVLVDLGKGLFAYHSDLPLPLNITLHFESEDLPVAIPRRSEQAPSSQVPPVDASGAS
jgi:hypothetical protein